jgi:NAD(P)-dependent dehydrogenase (short-subunit alcohol dehydrogenase family)
MLSPDLKWATRAENLEATIGCKPLRKSEEDMKVLVTGATGNVGSLLAGELLKRGAEVRALIRKPDADHKLPASVEAAIGDLLDPLFHRRSDERRGQALPVECRRCG